MESFLIFSYSSTMIESFLLFVSFHAESPLNCKVQSTLVSDGILGSTVMNRDMEAKSAGALVVA